ncbi:MAG: hypothetical protein HC853_10465 [Anaerolineae bacterium]|nr:hypothetical protein [Anaerolineae bacterium]
MAGLPAGGARQAPVAAAAGFEHQVADRLLALQRDLRSRTYRPGDYHHFFIHEPKRRKISAAPFRDRVVHHALCHHIQPLFEARFIAHSYANRVGKGTMLHWTTCKRVCGAIGMPCVSMSSNTSQVWITPCCEARSYK